MKDEIKNISFIGIILIVVIGFLAVSMIDFSVNNKIVTGDNKLKSFGSYSELKEFLKKNSEQGNGGYGFGIMEKSTTQGASAPSADSAGNGAALRSSDKTEDYSRTNIQVEGVDESDVVKNDGEYIYNIVGNKIVIVNAFPSSEMKLVGEIDLDKNKNPTRIFLNDDKLIVFASGYKPVATSEGDVGEASTASVGDSAKVSAAGGVASGIAPLGYYGGSSLYVYIYDVSDKKNPQLYKEIDFDGNYVDSRMIGDYVYVINSKYVQNDNPILPVYSINGIESKMAINDIYYFDYPDYNYVFNSINAINIKNGEVNSKIYLTGGTNAIYVSANNIYLTYTKFISGREYWDKSIKEVIAPLLPESEREKINRVLDSDKGYDEKVSEVNHIVQDYSNSLTGDEKSDFDGKLYRALNEFEKEIRRERQKTVINKINVDGLDIKYMGNGEVGAILNQFSMDEKDGYLRIATTSGEIWDGSSDNNLYVLDKDLDIAGKIEKLAPGERIYSARFIGDRAYLVTFKSIDPFYVIDLSKPESPKVLGYLKIPGYSDYLHPYDDTHIIGIGKDVNESIDADKVHSENAFYYTAVGGMKIAVFDVSDVANPKESANIIVGDRGTDSNALYDHKAFLFDKKRNLLVLPISLAEKDKSKYEGEITWQGAYVFDINLNEIKVKGRITHFDNLERYGPASNEPVGAERKDFSGNIWIKVGEDKWKIKDNSENPNGKIGYGEAIWSNEIIDSQPGGINYNPIYDYRYQIQRSLYIGNTLYTLSSKIIEANNLGDLQEVGKIDLPYSESYGGPVIY